MGKRIYIGHESAQAFWRSHDGNDLLKFERVELPALQSACANARAISACQLDSSFFLGQQQISVLVSSPKDKHKAKHVSVHVWDHPTTFYRVANGIYVSSPEDTALQLASSMSREQTLLYLFELTSTYARQGLAESTTYNRVPLCTIASLTRKFESATRVRGLNMLKELLPFVASNSASPMESILTATFVLPIPQGGYEFEIPYLNQRIIATPTGTYRKGDLYWPQYGVDLEYQSELFHTGYDRTIQDGMRSNELVAAATKVFEANFDHFRVSGAMDTLASQLCDAMERPRPDNSPAAQTARRELRSRLLAVDGICLDAKSRYR